MRSRRPELTTRAVRARSLDLEQLHLEAQRGAGLDQLALAGLPVGDRGRAVDLGLAADVHQLQTLGPAGNHAVEREDRGLVALVRAVELRAVAQRAAVVNLDGIGGRGRRAVALLGLEVHQARVLDLSSRLLAGV